MSWTLNQPPVLAPNSVATKRGWENPTTGEVMVSIQDLSIKAAAGDIISVEFGAETYEQADPLSVTVTYNERVNVTAGASLVVTSTGTNTTLYAAAQSNVNEVVFNKQANLTDAAVVPSETATLSLGEQTISGTIEDALGAVPASGVLTCTANFANNETVVIDNKTYTFKSTLTNSNGYVKLGSTLAESLANLSCAINLSPSQLAGVAFAVATTIHSTVSSVADSTTLTVTAKTAGTSGNSLTTTTNGGNASWGNGTLQNGAFVASNKAISSVIGADAGTREVA